MGPAELVGLFLGHFSICKRAVVVVQMCVEEKNRLGGTSEVIMGPGDKPSHVYFTESAGVRTCPFCGETGDSKWAKMHSKVGHTVPCPNVGCTARFVDGSERTLEAHSPYCAKRK